MPDDHERDGFVRPRWGGEAMRCSPLPRAIHPARGDFRDLMVAARLNPALLPENRPTTTPPIEPTKETPDDR